MKKDLIFYTVWAILFLLALGYGYDRVGIEVHMQSSESRLYNLERELKEVKIATIGYDGYNQRNNHEAQIKRLREKLYEFEDAFIRNTSETWMIQCKDENGVFSDLNPPMVFIPHADIDWGNCTQPYIEKEVYLTPRI